MQERFEEFLRERLYLKNVTPKTLRYYQCAFRAWEKHGGEPKQWVINLRQAGLSPVSVNTYICAMNAYWKWAEAGIKLNYLKEEQKILETLSPEALKKIISYRPIGVNLTRAHLVALTILDTGLRASEVLGLTKENVDLDNMTFRVIGKGGKHRLVPFSNELRKRLWAFCQKRILGTSNTPERAIVLYGTKNNTQVSVRNLERDFKILGQELGITGIRFSPHTLRHTFALQWLTSGGDIYMLSRILGHTSIQTTTIYLRSLGISDLQRAHSSHSPLRASR